ncbi:MAG TPA: sulfatase-like hydrolase/transferase [Paludibacter sp.]|nr:sulfatase-like hydrolase/transferase [Paludibacter sp.]
METTNPGIVIKTGESFFVAEAGAASVVHSFPVQYFNIENDFGVSVTGSFELSADKNHWGKAIIMSPGVKYLYVRYLPGELEGRETGVILFSSPEFPPKEITLTGMSYKPAYQAEAPDTKVAQPAPPKARKPRPRFGELVSAFGPRILTLFAVFVLLRVYELSINQLDGHVHSSLLLFEGASLSSDIIYLLGVSGLASIVFGAVYFISRRLSVGMFTICCILAAIVQLLLVTYFSTVLNPLGADAFQYSFAEVKQTLGASLSVGLMARLVAFVTLISLVFVYLPTYLKLGKTGSWIIVIVSLAGFACYSFGVKPGFDFGSEYDNNLYGNKSDYFLKSVYAHFPNDRKSGIFDEMPLMFADDNLEQGSYKPRNNDFVYPDAEHFPFLHDGRGKGTLEPFFAKGTVAPNYVFIIVEGLGCAFSNSNAYLGSFTPFLDSLSNRSLYWENCLSSAGRTFEVLPSVLGSLPYGEHGFPEYGDKMPKHLTFPKILVANGYRSAFFYAGDSRFDNMDRFMKRQNTSVICDQSSFGVSYRRLPANAQGYSWGYGDNELYRKYFDVVGRNQGGKPQVHVLLTVSTHSPFAINEQGKYNLLFEKRLHELKLDEATMAQRRMYKAQFASILAMDDALKHFFSLYRKLPSYSHTIFVITGDHRMPDIPMTTKIDRYHVPLIVYSPMLKRNAKFEAVVSHLDIVPSLLALQKRMVKTKAPALVTWLGAGLDTTRNFCNNSNYPFIQTKDGVSGFLSGKYMYEAGQLYSISEGMEAEPANDEFQQKRLVQLLGKFKDRNKKVPFLDSLVPDSIYAGY